MLSITAHPALPAQAAAGSVDLQVEDLLRVVLEDHLLVGRAQPVDRFDREPRFVEPAARPRILHRAHARPLRAEQASIDADGLEEQLERVLRVEHGVVVELAHLIREARPLAAQRAGLEARVLIRNRAAAVRHEDLQRRKIVEHLRVQQRDDGDVLFVDEVQRVGQPLGAAAGRVDVAGDVELDELFVQRIPEAIAERRRLDAAALARIGIQQAADESLLLDALLEIRQDGLRADARRQRQAADAAEGVGIELAPASR